MPNTILARSAPIVLIALALIAITWTIALHVIGQDYRTKLRQGEERARELSGFFERDTRRILQMAELYIFEVQRIFESEGVEAIPAFTDRTLGSQEAVSHITITDADGTPLFVSGHEPRHGASLGDRSYFRQLREMPTGATVISLPYEGRNTGRLTVRLARSLRGPDGGFAGVIFAAIQTDQFTAFYRTLNLGPRSSATLIGTDDKRIRARSSYGRLGPGQEVGKSRLWTELAASDTGLYRQTSVVDGITRFYAYRRMPDYPLLTTIGLAEEDVVVDAEAFARPIYAIAGLTTLVIAVFSTMLCRDLEARARMMREIAERRATEAKLARANTDLLHYAHSASHDLKAPLSTISGLLDFCIEDLESGEHGELRENLGEAGDIARRSARKVESLLRIARSGSGEEVIETFSLEALVREIWSDQTASRRVACELELALGCDRVRSERSSLCTILENLISNAFAYRDDKKASATVRVESSAGQGGVRLCVSDNGVGIAPEFLPKVFHSFASFDDRGGDGLGLALVQKHVMRLGGTISVDSALGEGTSFEIQLPIKEEDDDEHSRRGRGRQQDRQVHHTAAAVA